MSWQRLGLVYCPDGSRPWAASHAAMPVPVPLGGDRFRVFFSARDAQNRSSVGWVDIEIGTDVRIVGEATEPVLTFGTPGTFDDSGISIGCFVDAGSSWRLYYLGWNLSVSVPWRNSIGVAQGSIEPPRFERMFEGPIIDRSPEDPFLVSYPWVLRIGPADWRMWYASHDAWGSDPAANHVIKIAYSDDGLRWRREREPVLRYADPAEYTMARPSVLLEDGVYRMWFAVRAKRYKIGYAESADGRKWTRLDARYGLEESGEGWDSEMVCYPCAFRHRGRLYLAYCGNGYGRSGFGLAQWQNGEAMPR